MSIDELWQAHNDTLGMIKLYRDNLKKIRKEIEQTMAAQLGLKQVMMTSWGNCSKSPTGFCFEDPNAPNPWVCVLCGVDSSRPK